MWFYLIAMNMNALCVFLFVFKADTVVFHSWRIFFRQKPNGEKRILKQIKNSSIWSEAYEATWTRNTC